MAPVLQQRDATAGLRHVQLWCDAGLRCAPLVVDAQDAGRKRRRLGVLGHCVIVQVALLPPGSCVLPQHRVFQGDWAQRPQNLVHVYT